jgi:hypothetical protein
MEITDLSKRIKWLQQAIHRGGRKMPVLRGGGNAERPSAPTQETMAVKTGPNEVGNATEIVVGFGTDSVGDVIPPGTKVPTGRSL